MSSPLQGIRVLDFSRVLAGPFASRMLADLGAEVLKVEPPDGDVTRLWGRKIAGIAGYYFHQNAGKQGLCIDLARPEGVDLVKQLVSHVDVVLENFRPGVMERLGLGWEVLSALNPRLVMLSISGFGQTGPETGRAAYAPIIHAESGVLDRYARLTGQPPAELPLSVADTNASLHGLVALLAALYRREQDGRGDHIDMAMIDAMLATDDHLHAALEPADQEPEGVPRSEVWQTGAGPVILSGDLRWIWHQLTRHYGVEDPTPPGSTLEQKIAHRLAAVQAFFAGLQDWSQVIEAMERMNLAWGRVKTSREAVETSATLGPRDSITEVPDRAGGVRRVMRSPYRFRNAESGIRGPAPRRGEHNREVLQRYLGLSGEALTALEDSGVLLSDPPADGAS